MIDFDMIIAALLEGHSIIRYEKTIDRQTMEPMAIAWREVMIGNYMIESTKIKTHRICIKK